MLATRMILPFFAVALTFGLAGSSLGQQTSPAPAPTATSKSLTITGSHTLRITYDFIFTWPKGGGYTAVLHLPIPPETGAQHIVSFTSSIKGTTETFDNETPPHRLLTATLHHKSGDERRVHWTVEIVGDFHTRQLVDNPPGTIADPAPTLAPGPGEFLSATESLNWKDDVFQGWLDSAGLRRAEGERPVDYAARVYAYLQAHGHYSYPPGSAWNAAAVCHHLGSDCGGFSTVFTAACRANKIPARMLVGQWFKAANKGGTVELTDGRQSHVIAEFYDPRLGWIPEDISSTFLKTPGYADLNFFGRDPGYFFTWHFDNDFHFDLPRKANAHVQWIQNPNLWFSANADEANDTVSHHWTVETVK